MRMDLATETLLPAATLAKPTLRLESAPLWWLRVGLSGAGVPWVKVTMTQAEGEASLVLPRECANGRLRGVSAAGVVEIEIEGDPVTGTRQWFWFGLRGKPGTIVRIVNAGACTYPGGWATSVIWMRAGRGAWRPLEFSVKDGVASFAHGGGAAEYALFPPYPSQRLGQLVERARARADVVEADASVGRALRLSFGDGDPAARQVWVIAGQHGSEHPALWFADGFVGALLGRRRKLAGIRFHIVPVANPGGWLAGHLRTNVLGQDPNRFWAEPQACPEVASLHAAMAATGVDVLLDVHTDFEMGCVYLDVLDEWMGTPPALAAGRERFERGLAEASPDVAYGKRYPWKAPPEPALLAGMCAPAVERRFDAAAITLELPIGRYTAADGRQGVWTPRHSQALGRAAAGVLMRQRNDVPLYEKRLHYPG